MSKDNSAKNPKALEVTSATHWRKLREEGVIVMLPSGNTAKLRPVSLLELAKRGRIPDSLTGVAANTVANGRPSADQIQNSFKATTDLLYLICEVAFISPRVIVPEDGKELEAAALNEDEITVYHLSFEDQLFVLDFISAPTRSLERFRQEQERSLASMDNGKVVQTEAERDPERS